MRLYIDVGHTKDIFTFIYYLVKGKKIYPFSTGGRVSIKDAQYIVECVNNYPMEHLCTGECK